MFKLRYVAIALSISFCAFAQNHPYPRSVIESPAICSGCGGTNSVGEPNEGKPTVPFDVPLADHVGRYVSSSSTANVQHLGMRTVRAGRVRPNPSNGRLYLQLGSTIGAYSLDTFFTTRLLEPLYQVSVMNTGSRYSGRSPLEKVARPDGFIYPEAKSSGWVTPFVDSTDRLEDFDSDDRGLVYYHSSIFGWGIHQDDGRTDGTLLPFVAQVQEPFNAGGTLFSIKSGSSYYVYASDSTTGRLFDVTVPAAPTQIGTRSNAHWVRKWAKHETAGHVAVIQGPGILRVYTYAAFLAGGAHLVEYAPETGRKFTDLAFDGSGNLWVADLGASSLLWKLSAGSYQKTTYALGDPGFQPESLHAAAGYVAVAGTDPVAPGHKHDLLLFDVVDGAPQLMQTFNWFRRYYHWAPSGYAQPQGYTNVNVRPFLFAQGGHTYLFYSAYGLGDVYEINNTLTPPGLQVLAASPLTGPPAGGTVVTIDGTGFSEDAVVKFDNLEARTTYVNSGQLTAIAPAHANGKVWIFVTSGGETVPGTQFTYALGLPGVLHATATSGTEVSLSWNTALNASSYEVFRDGVSIGTTPSITFDDSGLTPNTAYVYFIRALDTAGNFAGNGPSELAMTLQLTEPEITPGMKVKALHLSELGTAVNVLRAKSGLPAVTWTTSPLIRASHVEELRTALRQARDAVGLFTPAFTDASLAGERVKAVHVQELVNGVR